MLSLLYEIGTLEKSTHVVKPEPGASSVLLLGESPSLYLTLLQSGRVKREREWGNYANNKSRGGKIREQKEKREKEETGREEINEKLEEMPNLDSEAQSSPGSRHW